MTDPAGPFLAAILTSPDDDAPRLVYADWLDERDKCDRAEFIRVQMALARDWAASCYEGRPIHDASCYTGSCRGCALRRRERELLGVAAVEDWSAFPGFVQGWVWRRGFVESVTLTAAAWLAHADALTAAAPILEVGLATWPNVHEYAAARPGMMPSGPPARSRLPSHGPLELRTTEWLAAEWPRIWFTLPGYGRPQVRGTAAYFNGRLIGAATEAYFDPQPDVARGDK